DRLGQRLSRVFDEIVDDEQVRRPPRQTALPAPAHHPSLVALHLPRSLGLGVLADFKAKVFPPFIKDVFYLQSVLRYGEVVLVTDDEDARVGSEQQIPGGKKACVELTLAVLVRHVDHEPTDDALKDLHQPVVVDLKMFWRLPVNVRRFAQM